MKDVWFVQKNGDFAGKWSQFASPSANNPVNSTLYSPYTGGASEDADRAEIHAMCSEESINQRQYKIDMQYKLIIP